MNGFLSFQFILLVSGLGLAALSVYLLSSTLFGNNSDASALAWASGDEPVKSKSNLINFSRPLVHNFTIQHARRIKNQNYRNAVERKLLTSGLSQELNVDEFIGLQILLGAFFPLALITLNFALQLGYSDLLNLLIGLGGIYYPHMYCNSEKNRRYISVIVDLPFFIDLMALSTEAGLDFVGAIQKISDKSGAGTLSDEFRILLQDIKLGSSRKDALMSLGNRLDIPEITSFVAVVRDADESGTPISQVLKDQSIQMRLERMVRAEKAGAKASQMIFLPLVAFIFPAILIIVMGPAILQFWYGGK